MEINPLTAATQSAVASASESASAQLTANFDTFLTLLTAQLRNQDPLEPLDTEQFTQQLVQFAGVEQSIQTNQNLEALLALQTASSNETALALVGRVATVDSDTSALSAETPAQWRFTLPQRVESATAQVFDQRGALIAEFDAPTDAGAHNIAWAGQTSNGGRAPEGTYRVVINALSAEGAPVEASISTRGRVDAVAFDNGVAAIEIAGTRFGLEQVLRADIDF